jgi:hypothetical protein
MRGNLERPNVINAAPLNASAQTTFSKELPVGEGWYGVYLTINIALTIGTGTTPITEGELLFIKNVQLRTDRGEIVCNLPGRAIWKIAAIKSGALPHKDAIAAATATYRVHLPIFLADFWMLRPEDTVLDTERHNSLTLSVTLGSVSDLLTTPGTAAIVCTLDVELERSFGALPDGGKPIGFINYDSRPPVDANSTQFIDLERASDMSIKRVYLHTGSSGTGGIPWSGTNSDTRIASLNIKDQSRQIEKDRLWESIQYQNKLDAKLESLLSGVVWFDFVKDRSILSAMATADKSLLQMVWTNETAAANNITTLTQENIRTLK